MPRVTPRLAVGVTLVAWLVVAVASLVLGPTPSTGLPAAWLKDWTELIAKAVTAAIGAGVLWKAADQFQRLAGHDVRDDGSTPNGPILTMIGVWAAFALGSLLASWPGPAGWLTAWTDLVIKAAAAAIAARVLWAAPGALRALLARRPSGDQDALKGTR